MKKGEIFVYVLLVAFIFAVIFFVTGGRLKLLLSDPVITILVIIIFVSATVTIFSFAKSSPSADLGEEIITQSLSSSGGSIRGNYDDKTIVVINESSNDFWKGFKFGMGLFLGFALISLIGAILAFVGGISIFSMFMKGFL